MANGTNNLDQWPEHGERIILDETRRPQLTAKLAKYRDRLLRQREELDQASSQDDGARDEIVHGIMSTSAKIAALDLFLTEGSLMLDDALLDRMVAIVEREDPVEFRDNMPPRLAESPVAGGLVDALSAIHLAGIVFGIIRSYNADDPLLRNRLQEP
jgi:hypothetical protein